MVLYSQMPNHTAFMPQKQYFHLDMLYFPPKVERTLLLGSFRNIKPLWGDAVYEVTVRYRKRWKARPRKTVCPVEIGTYRSQINVEKERQIEKDAKKAFHSMVSIERSLKAIAASLENDREA